MCTVVKWSRAAPPSLSLSRSLSFFSPRANAHPHSPLSFTVVESCVKFITRNSYIMIAMRNLGFLRASSNAIGLLTTNVFYLVPLKALSTAIVLLGKIIVICVCGGLAAIWMRYDPIFAIGGVSVWRGGERGRGGNRLSLRALSLHPPSPPSSLLLFSLFAPGSCAPLHDALDDSHNGDCCIRRRGLLLHLLDGN